MFGYGCIQLNYRCVIECRKLNNNNINIILFLTYVYYLPNQTTLTALLFILPVKNNSYNCRKHTHFGSKIMFKPRSLRSLVSKVRQPHIISVRAGV